MRFLSLVLFLFFVACTPSVKSTQLSVKPMCNGSTLYAKIDRQKNGISITEISERPGKEYDPYIRLNDLKPMFSTQQANCVTGTMGEITKGLGEQCFPNSAIYREKFVGGGDAVITGLGNILTLGGLAGPGGEPVGAGRYSYTNYFDFESYRKDLTEFDQDVDTCDLVRLYDDKKALFVNSVREYRDGKNHIPIKIVVRDSSGFYFGDGHEFKSKIKIDLNEIDEFNSISGLGADGFENLYRDLEKKLDDLISAAKNKFYYRIDIDSGPLNGYGFNVIFNDKINYIDYKNDHFAHVEISGKDFVDCIPKYYFSDENISGSIDKNGIHIENKTEYFITVESVSIYYGDNITTSDQVSLEFPPKSSINMSDLFCFLDVKNKAKFYDLNKAAAEMNKINFGVAIKYKFLDRDKEVTLFKNKDFRLIDLLG